MKVKKLLIVLFFFILCNYSISIGETQSGLLVIGGEFGSPPLEFIDEEDTYRGFNVDLINALSIEMGIDIKLEPFDWVDLQVSLQNDQIDAILGMNYNDSRQEIYEFSDEYLVTSSSLFVLESNEDIFDVEHLKGKRVGVQRSDFAAYILADIGGVELVFFPNLDEAYNKLLGGVVDAVFGNKLAGIYSMKENNYDDRIKIVGDDYNHTSYGLAFKKGNIELREQFNEALESLKSKGTYNQIYTKWFGQDLSERDDRPFIIVSIATIILLLISIIVIKISNTLKYQVEKRTRELTSLNSELQHKKQEIVESNKYKEQIINGIADGLITFDQNKIITTVNNSCEKILAIDSLDYIGKSLDKVDLDKYFDMETIEICINKGIPIDHYEKNFNKYGREITLSYLLRPLYDVNNTNIGGVITFNDVTELNNLRNLSAERERMQSIAAIISGMSHEIRNPLTTIKTYIDLLPKKYDSLNFRKKITEQVPLEISRLNTLLTDLINLTSSKKLKKEIFDLTQVVNHVIKVYSVEMDEKNIQFNYVDEIYTPVYCDKQQLVQIIVNIIKNSIEAIHTKGKIEITIDKSSELAELIIRDTGEGIAKENLNKIHDPFFTTKEKGTGLGLSIIYKYAMENGIKMDISSVYGEGSQVKLTFDLNRGEQDG